MVSQKSSFLEKALECIPKKHHIRGSWLHRLVGERIFSAELWGFSKEGVARGLALGVFIALTPTMGIHMALAGMTAFFLRGNIPVALAACWITNPLSAPIIYGLQYKLGVLLIGVGKPEATRGLCGIMENIMCHAKPLWTGSLISGVVCGIMSYGAVFVGWEGLSRHLVHFKEGNGHHVSDNLSFACDPSAKSIKEKKRTPKRSLLSSQKA